MQSAWLHGSGQRASQSWVAGCAPSLAPQTPHHAMHHLHRLRLRPTEDFTEPLNISGMMMSIVSSTGCWKGFMHSCNPEL